MNSCNNLFWCKEKVYIIKLSIWCLTITVKQAPRTEKTDGSTFISIGIDEYFFTKEKNGFAVTCYIEVYTKVLWMGTSRFPLWKGCCKLTNLPDSDNCYSSTNSISRCAASTMIKLAKKIRKFAFGRFFLGCQTILAINLMLLESLFIDP